MKTEYLMIRISPELKERLFALCDEEAINTSELLRKLIQTWVEDKESKKSSQARD